MHRSQTGHILTFWRSLQLWALFFLICLGLGYATLNRYDIRRLGDQEVYARMVTGQATPADFPYRFRLLVPELAKAFYRLANGHDGTWDAVAFGLLVSNSIFTAATAVLLVACGLHVLGDWTVCLLGAALYFLNFLVPNEWLAGMVDSSEAFFLLGLTWLLLTARWR